MSQTVQADYIDNAENVFFGFIDLFKNGDFYVNEDELSESLSSAEIEKVLSNAFGSHIPALAYSDVFNAANASQKNYLRDFLHKIPQRMFIFLYRQMPNYGHWCAMFEHPQTGELYIFDSYGKKKPDEYILNGPYEIKALGQNAPYLLDCFINSNYSTIIWNDHKFQKSGLEIQTCGKWCVVRLICSWLTIDEFNKCIESIKKNNNTSADGVICVMFDVLKRFCLDSPQP